MSFSLPDTILTTRDIKRVIDALKSADSQDKGLIYDKLPAEARAVVDGNKQAWEQESVADFIQQLEAAYKETPVFDVILPSYPHDSFLHELSSWFRREIHSNSLLEVSVRRNIGGGMVLRSKNRLFDMSLRPKIIENKDKIPEVLRRV